MRRFNLLPKYLLVAITLSIVLVAATAVTLFTVYRSSLNELVTTSILSNNSAIGENMSRQATGMTRKLAAQLSKPLKAGSQAEINALIDRTRDLNNALLIVVRDITGRSISQAGEPGELREGGSANQEFVGIDGRRLVVRAPVMADNEMVGSVTQVFDIGPVVAASDQLHEKLDVIRENFVRSSVFYGAVIAALAIAVTSLLAAAIAYRQVRAIRSLTSGARAVAKGRYDEDLPVRRMDELGQLARAFSRMRDALRDTTVSRDFLDSVLGSMSDAIILTTATGRIARVNEAACRLLDYPEDDILGMSVQAIVADPHRDRFLFDHPQLQPMESVFVTRTGDQLPVSYSSSEINSDNADSRRFIIVARNISDRKIAERRIRYLARIDALTKVPNRMQFQHLLQRSIARARRGNQRLALLYLDVDRFKDINDTFGHSAGDTCLETLTSRIIKLLPEESIVGRLAGDEFGIVIDKLSVSEDNRALLGGIAREVLAALADVLIVQGHEIYMSASVGIAFYPDDADNVLDLIRNADAALYHGKRSGGNRAEFYDPSMNAEAVERLMLKSKLRRSYELDELLINYQPKIDLATGDVVGAEALVRWELSEHGLVLPSEFIPLAEETGLILEIGEWVLNRVCADYRGWQRQIGSAGRISVNLSLKQLSQPNFNKRVNRIFKRHNLSPACLELEITESTLMRDVERTVKLLDELHEMGLHIAIDDFGTGYSSLSALQQFPINTLKIDKSFVRDAATNADDATIVSTIIDMAHSLNMKVVAEGVESEEQLNFLKSLNCDYVQGLLFGNPMAAGDYLDLILGQHGGTGTYRTLFG